MKAQELRQFSAGDLKSRIETWKEELFRSRFKTEASEARDTSVVRKLRRDIARAYTILAQKTTEGAAAAAPQDKPAKKAAPKAKKTAKTAKTAKSAEE